MIPLLVDDLVRSALREDLGRAGDVTTDAIVPADAVGEARLVAREEGVVSGVAVAERVFTLLDPRVRVEIQVRDGGHVQRGTVIATLRGPLRAILTGERTALNLVGRLSGIASATARLTALVAGTRAAVVDTRKTTPGLRALEKAAVRDGGGANHRFGLDDAILIKDNHVAIAGGIAPAIRAARAHAGHLVKIEVEVDTLAQLDEALAERADIVLLDNFTPEELRVAVERTAGRALLEASGNINDATIGAVARSGVDLISVGALTHSVRALDVGLDID
ncbi:MAG TPA: carboxylating nicotinate-nucleotide diphosphorylase [Candidatus Sulfotelmatobacter sp.]|nr:carboxylating nicotinate-nucleotide diphosphorylase [Candidatus Sulfotelmatobacter sp.]